MAEQETDPNIKLISQVAVASILWAGTFVATKSESLGHSGGLAMRIALVVVGVGGFLPVLFVYAKSIRMQDEFNQRIHYIALSIAFVAAENLFLSPVVSRRWLVSFCFGLVHGFGFSSVLREVGLPTQGLVLSLLGFNVGVELGQALVVALALPALALLRRTHWETRVVRIASLATLLVGSILFVERALF